MKDGATCLVVEDVVSFPDKVSVFKSGEEILCSRDSARDVPASSRNHNSAFCFMVQIL